MPYAASQVNNITTRMLQKQGKDPVTAYRELVQFFGDAMQGDTFLCAHNASFDMKFLSAALDRYGYFGTLRCIGTLGLSQELINMGHHRLGDVARHFHIENTAAHRAAGDAETCGRILVNLLPLKKKRIDKELAQKAKATKTKTTTKTNTDNISLTDDEIATAAIIINGLRHNGEVDALRLYKRSGFVEIVEDCPYIRFKITKTMSYVLMPKAIPATDIVIKECSSSEVSDNVRLLFNDPKELMECGNVLVRIYRYYRNRRYDAEHIKSAKYYSRANLYYLPESKIARVVTENGGEYLTRAAVAAKAKAVAAAAKTSPPVPTKANVQDERTEVPIKKSSGLMDTLTRFFGLK